MQAIGSWSDPIACPRLSGVSEQEKAKRDGRALELVGEPYFARGRHGMTGALRQLAE